LEKNARMQNFQPYSPRGHPINLGDRRELQDGQTDRESAHRTERTRRALQFGYWKQSIEKLKEKWTAFTRGIIRAIAEEEMKISREEFDKQIGARTR
jgi:hypothetical protein